MRVRAAVRRLEFDLLRYLRHEAEREGDFEPEHLELRFGFDDSEHPAGARWPTAPRVRGVIDRVDTWNGHALVIDYKSGKVDNYKAADWDEGATASRPRSTCSWRRSALGLQPAGGVYIPLGGKERRSRGALDEALAAQLGDGFYDNDVLPERRVRRAERARAGAGSARWPPTCAPGELCSTPDSCAYRGGCSHPSICRVEAS